MSNSDRGAIGFLMNIACAWSAGLDGNPLDGDCGELMMIRNVQLSLAALIALIALANIFFVVRGIRRGQRQVDWRFTWGRAVRVGLAIILLIRLVGTVAHRYPLHRYLADIARHGSYRPLARSLAYGLCLDFPRFVLASDGLANWRLYPQSQLSA